MGVPSIAARHVMRRRRRPRGGQPYNPLTAFDWKAAFYAGDPLWTPPADGGPVSSWRDGGSEGKNATQATGTKQPAYRASVAALNDKPAIQGDGVDDFLQTAAWSSALTQPYSLVLIGNVAGAVNNLCDGVTSTALVGTSSGQWRLSTGTSRLGSSGYDTDAHLFVAVTGATDVLSVDGATEVSADAGAGTLDGLSLLANKVGSFGGGHLAFVAAIAGDVTADANWSAFVAWVESHYGLAVA